MRQFKSSMTVVGLLVLLLSGCGGGGGGSSSSSGSSNTSTNTSAAPNTFQSMGGTGRVTIAWNTNPTNVDGSCSSGTQAYQISLGLAPNLYLISQTIYASQLSCSPVANSACGQIQRCSYTIQGLTSASWHIAAQAVDMYGYQSGYSNEAIATVN